MTICGRVRRGAGSVGLIVLLAGVAASAEAHWQSTTWGMSPQALVAASSGTAHLATEAEPKPVAMHVRAVGTATMDQRGFRVRYLFREEKLVAVNVMAIDPSQCEDIMYELRQQRGSPTQTMLDINHWVTKGQDDLAAVDASALYRGGTCTLTYWAPGQMPQLRPLLGETRQ